MSFKEAEVKCSWCGHAGATIKHHYPIQKQHGGTETVKICPNCHRAAHIGIIVDALTAVDEADFERIVEEKTLEAIRTTFPLLYATGEFYEPFTRKMALNPPWKWHSKAAT